MRLSLMIVGLTAIVSAATPDFSSVVYGPSQNYAGYGSSWAIISFVPASGYAGHVYFEPVTLPSGITLVPWCGEAGGTYGLATKSCFYDAASGRWYQYGEASVTAMSVVYQITASGAVAPGTYSLAAGFTIGSAANGWVTHAVPLPLRVVAVPTVATPTLTHYGIPGVIGWQASMTALGTTWCTMASPPNFVYSNTGESLQNYRSIWYYDGGGVYAQIADYTGNAGTWDPCATWVLDDYSAHILAQSPSGYGLPLGNEVFSRGLYLGWKHTGNVNYTAALTYLMAHSPYSAPGGLMINPVGSAARDPGLRETALMGNLYLYALRAGLIAADSANALRIRRNAEWLLLYFDQTYAQGNPQSFDQAFYTGIACEFLIRWYEYSGDPRIPAAVKTALDYHWAHTVDQVNGGIQYSTFPSTQSSTGIAAPLCAVADGGCPIAGNPNYTKDLNNLIAPAWAWYWRTTGDDTYRAQGDFIFSHAVAATDKAKSYSQHYYWSIDFVKWRTNWGPYHQEMGTIKGSRVR